MNQKGKGIKMSNKKLVGKVAVVTGASKGIGAGIAKHLAAEGGAVVVNYASSKEGADQVVDEITKGGGKAIAPGPRAPTGGLGAPSRAVQSLDCAGWYGLWQSVVVTI